MSGILANGGVLWLQIVIVALLIALIVIVLVRLRATERMLAIEREAAVREVERRAADLAAQAAAIAAALDAEQVRRAEQVALTLEQKMAIVERKLDTVASDVVHGIAATHNVIVHELSPDDSSPTTRETITAINEKTDQLLGKIKPESKADADS